MEATFEESLPVAPTKKPESTTVANPTESTIVADDKDDDDITATAPNDAGTMKTEPTTTVATANSTTTTVATATGTAINPVVPTPMKQIGFNKGLREISRICLGVTALALFSNCNGIATIASAGAIIVLRDAKLLSTRNIKWKLLSILSFIFSLIAYCLGGTAATFGDTTNNKMDAFEPISDGKLLLQGFFIGWMKFYQLFWGSILTFVLISAYTSKAKEHDKTIAKLQPAKID